jgi:type IV pilus assembly protein PilQ
MGDGKMGMIKRKRALLFAVFLMFGLSFNLTRAQSTESQSVSPLISMDFQDADLKDVLKVFSQQADLNFIAGERVKERKVTLYLEKVSVQDALNTIMSANNLIYEQKKDSKIFVVKEDDMPEVETITKVFPLQYARVKGCELTLEDDDEDEGFSGGEASVEAGIEEVIRDVLSSSGRLVEDARTNSLVITDVPGQFPKIEKAIEELDIKLPQVMIEAEIIETSLDTIDKLGIQWGTSADGELASAAGASQSVRYPFTKDSSNPRIGPGGDVSGLYMGYISAMNLSGVLSMLKKDTDTRILARPKILTLNNETAEIKITADTAVSEATTEIAAEGGVSTSTTTIERYETGVKLIVTPQINNAGEITMSIVPSVVNTKSSGVVSGVSDPHTRSARTIVTVGDGETVIIGGLINTEDEKILRKVPFLGDIPLLGNIFRKKNDTLKDKELVIFITPHLVKERTQTSGLILEKQAVWEDEPAGLKEEVMERILDKFEE